MNYYEILGLTAGATADEVKKAYRRAAQKHHPDKGGNEAEFKKVNEAYEAILSGKAQSDNNEFRDYTRNGDGFANLHDLFKTRGNGGAFNFNFDEFRNHHAAASITNPDFHISVPCTLEEAHSGFEKDIDFTDPEGNKKQMSIKFPPGSTTDIKVRYAGLGSAVINGKSAGDLYVRIVILDHTVWTLNDGRNLVATVEITVWQAMFGATITIKTIDGKDLEVNVPPGTQHCSQLRLRDRGFRIRGTEKNGNAFLILDVLIPKLEQDDMSRTVLDIINKIV